MVKRMLKKVKGIISRRLPRNLAYAILKLSYKLGFSMCLLEWWNQTVL